MKKWICLLLALALGTAAAGCSADDSPTTDPLVTNAPVNGTDTEETTAQDDPAARKITRPDIMIYTGPGYDYADTGTLLEPGIYTLTEETVDDEGFTWGRLKSGAGWIDLTKAAAEAPHIPLTLALTDAETAHGTDCHLYAADETDYTRWLYLEAYETLTDVRLSFMDFTEDGFRPGEARYTLDTWTADKPLILGVVFYGDFTTFGLTFTDAAGTQRTYRIFESGRNGSVMMQEYAPQK